MPSVAAITVGRLNEDGCFRETLGIDLAPDVVKPDSLADVPTGLLHHTIAVHVGEKPQTEPLKNRHILKVTSHHDWFSFSAACRLAAGASKDLFF